MHERSAFITLTYSPEHLPPDGSLRVKDWQDFAKRLRKRIGRFRFFHAGEYGSENNRPHYHAAIFGQDFEADRVFLRKSGNNTLYRSPLLDEVWAKGYASIGKLEPASASYIAKYVVKRCTGDGAYERVDQVSGEVTKVAPEYATMSRRPGIGAGFYERYGAELRRLGFVPLGDGKKAPIPSYYQKLFAKEDPEAARREALERQERVSKDPDNGWRRLRVREECAEARQQNRSR